MQKKTQSKTKSFSSPHNPTKTLTSSSLELTKSCNKKSSGMSSSEADKETETKSLGYEIDGVIIE